MVANGTVVVHEPKFMYHDSSFPFPQGAMAKISPKTSAAIEKQEAWTFLSNHAHVLMCLARDPNCRLRDVAVQVGITERACFKILSELERSEIVSHVRFGRRNHYEINLEAPLRHPLEAGRTLKSLLKALLTPAEMRAISPKSARIDD
jgi:hypothetical protein